MSIPGYTADLSLRPAIDHYSRPFTSPVAHELVVPQLDERDYTSGDPPPGDPPPPPPPPPPPVVVYDSWYGRDVSLGRGNVSAESKGPSGLPAGWDWSGFESGAECILGCSDTTQACNRNCDTNGASPLDRQICKNQTCTPFLRRCLRDCQGERYGLYGVGLAY